MISFQDPDLMRSAAHRQMIGQLTGPLAAGAVDTPVAIDAAGRLAVARNSREPLLIAGPVTPLDRRNLRLDAILDPDGAATLLPALTFAGYSEAGAFLSLHLPGVDEDTRTAAPFTLALSLTEIAADGTETALAAADIGQYVEVRLIEGNLGRLIFLLGQEKLRLRRQAREIAAMRQLPLARADALDRFGAELGVARFADEIQFDTAKNEVVTVVRRDANGQPVSEPDEEYRHRLAIYRPGLLPNRSGLLRRLNGPGEPGDPNRGLLSPLGVNPRFDILEADNEFAVAIHLVGSGGAAFRDNFLDFIRKVYLIWPANTPPANMIHAARFIPQAQRVRELALRNRLRTFFDVPANAAIAPLLAATLDRVGRCAQTLGLATPWPLLQAQDAAAGSRFELGLGVAVAPLPAAELDQLRDRLLDPNRPPAEDPDRPGEVDHEIEALLGAMTPRLAADDPEAGWLLQACGLRTVHRIDTDHIYLSHLPTFGLMINGPSVVNPGDKVDLQARYQAPGDPGSNVVLLEGLTGAASDWAGQGGAAWTLLTDADARTGWDQATPRPAADPALGIFRAAGLAAIATPAPLVTRLKRLPDELIATVRLDPAQAQRILVGDPAAVDELRALTGLLRQHKLVSVLPLITGPNEVVLVLGVIGLPEAGINLAERRATGFRWYVAPIQGQGGQVKAIGSRTVFVPDGPGLSALVAVGYARRGLTDPYEYRVELPDEARLSLKQYEFLMNLLQHAFPVGVEINTFSIRQEHVDLDGDGQAEPLSPTVSRTYRQFRRPRLRGEVGVILEEAS